MGTRDTHWPGPLCRPYPRPELSGGDAVLRVFHDPSSSVRRARPISSTNGTKSGTSRSTAVSSARMRNNPGNRRFRRLRRRAAIDDGPGDEMEGMTGIAPGVPLGVAAVMIARFSQFDKGSIVPSSPLLRGGFRETSPQESRLEGLKKQPSRPLRAVVDSPRSVVILPGGESRSRLRGKG